MKFSAKLVLPLLLLGFLPSPPTYAVSEDECAIWLCLPAAFPAGCSAAKSAFKKRVKKLKPPLPPFAACSVSGGSGMSYTQGTVVLVPAVTCGWGGSGWGGIGGIFGGACVPSPARWVKGGKCPTIACSTKRYIDVKTGGAVTGHTYMY